MNDELDRTMPDPRPDPGPGPGSDSLTPEEKRRLDALWRDLSLVRERPAMSELETEELLERIEHAAGLTDGQDMPSSGQLRASDPVGVRPDRAARGRLRPVRRRTIVRGIGLTIAAAAAVILFLRLPNGPVMLTVSPGEQLATVLSDGTSVVLNSGSRLTYDQTRRDGRHATLTGEAWFHVSKKESTFRVETENAVITVLGTQFSVRSRPVDGDPVTTVRVVEGQVLFTAPGADADGVILDRDRSASLTGDSETPVEQSVAVSTGAPAWTSGDLVFRDMPYHEAVEEASRRLGVSIGLQAPDVAERRINAAFRAPLDTSVVLEALCRPFGLKFRTVPEGYEIYRPANERDGP